MKKDVVLKQFWRNEPTLRKSINPVFVPRLLKDNLERLGVSVLRETKGDQDEKDDRAFVYDNNGVLERRSIGQIERLILDNIEDGIENTSRWEFNQDKMCVYDGGKVKKTKTIKPSDKEAELELIYENWMDSSRTTTEKSCKFVKLFEPEENRGFQDQSNVSYLTFQNNLVVITKNKIKVDEYKKYKKDKVWKEQRLIPAVPCDETKTKDLRYVIEGDRKYKGHFEFKIIPDDEWEKLEKKGMKGSPSKWGAGDWIHYLHCITSFPKKDKDETIIDWELDELKYITLKKMAGYLISTYKNKSNSPAVILTDSTGAENNSSDGGTGKSIFGGALKFLRNVYQKDGKTIKMDSQFLFQGLTKETQILFYDDVKEDFDLEKLFSALTGDLRIEGKGRDEIVVPFRESPKFYICSNHAIIPSGDKEEGNSDIRRQSMMEVSNYFSATDDNGETINPIRKEFNNRLLYSESWDYKEWNLFYNWMFRAVQYFIEEGSIENISELKQLGMTFSNTDIKKLKQQGVVSDDLSWFQSEIHKQFPKRENNEISKDEFWEKYKKDNKMKYGENDKQKEVADIKKFKKDFLLVVKNEGKRIKKTSNGGRYVRNNTEYFRIEN
jgi:hypothetical protein